MKWSLGMFSFSWWDLYSLSHSIVFLFLCIDHLGRLSYLSWLFFGTPHSDGYIFPFFICLSLLFFSQPSVRHPLTTTLPSCISFYLGWFWSLSSVQCYKPLSVVLQALCVSDPIPWIYSSPLLHNHKGFRSYLIDLVVFPTFFNLGLNFSIRSSWSES